MMQLDYLFRNSVKYLQTKGKCKNGFFAQEVGLGNGAAPSSANAIMALYKSELVSKEKLNIYIDELLNFQYKEGPHKYSFCKEEMSSVWSTAKCVYTILSVNPEKINNNDVSGAVRWLVDNQNSDCGWGFMKGKCSRPYYTYFVLQAIVKFMQLSTKDTDDITRQKYKDAVNNAYKFLTGTCHDMTYWTNGSDSKPCPVNTLTAIASLKIISQVFPTVAISPYFNESSKRIIRKGFMNEKSWAKLSWQETEGGLKKVIEPFPPGKIDILIYAGFDVLDEVIVYLSSYLLSHAIQLDEDNAGWLPPNAKGSMPYTWTTARSLYSLLEFREKIIEYAVEERINSSFFDIKDFLISKDYKIVNINVFNRIVNLLCLCLVAIYVIFLYKMQFFVHTIELLNFNSIGTLLTNLLILIFPVIFVYVMFRDIKKNGEINFKNTLYSIKDIIMKIKFW